MKTENKKSFSSKGIFPHQWAFTLLIPLRNLVLSPKKLIKRIKITPLMSVLEVGPGPGYFSVPVAKYLFWVKWKTAIFIYLGFSG